MKDNIAEEFPFVSTPVLHITSAMLSGALGDVVTNPLWVIRTRLQTLIMHPETRRGSHNMISAWGMTKMIYKEEGLLSFYKGLGASFLGLAHVAIQFPLYEYLKTLARGVRESEQESFVDLFCASVFSKLFASAFTYPHEILRSRLQDRRHISGSNDKGIAHLLRTIIKEEGFFSLWVGFRINIVRMVPSTASTFLTYEYVKRYLHSKFPEAN